MTNLLNMDIPTATTNNNKMAGGGFIALGYDNTKNYIWSNRRQCIVSIGASEIHNKGILATACEAAWIDITYGDDKNAYTKLGNNIASSCSAKGLYRADSVKGTGVWADPTNDSVLIVNTEEIFKSNGTAAKRITDDAIYLNNGTLGVTAQDVPATKEEIHSIKEALLSWSYIKPTDVDLVLGWIAHSFLCGALDWRVHGSITGPRGSGKSSMFELIKTLLGDSAFLLSGDSTQAGIRQKMGYSAKSVLCDESEANGSKIGDTLRSFREASSGATVARGNQQQTGISFEVRMAGLIAGIVPPSLNPADLSRFLLINLRHITEDNKKNMHPMIRPTTASKKEVTELGKKFFARMLSHWTEMRHAIDEVRAILIDRADGRFCDTYGTVIAASWVAQNEGFMTSEEAEQYIARFELEENIQATKDADDVIVALDHLLYTIVPGVNLSVSELLQSAVSTKTNGQQAVIGRYGMRADLDADDNLLLAIDFKNPELKKLFSGSNYEKGQLDKVFERLDSAKKIKAIRINGQVKSAIQVNTGIFLNRGSVRPTVDEIIASAA